MHASSSQTSLVRGLAWVLRAALVLQVWGAAAKYLFVTYESETPLFELLALDWLWPEPCVQQLDDWGVWLNFGCGLAVLLLAILAAGWSRVVRHPSPLERWMALWQIPLLAVPLLWELATATAGYIRMEGFMPPKYFFSYAPLASLEAWFFTDFAAHAVRFGIPLALMLLTPAPGRSDVGSRAFNTAMWLVRVAAALTFISHGMEALCVNPIFVDYILAASHKPFGYDLSQSSAEIMLQVIGALDLGLALLLVTGRFRSVAFYMAVWGLITACSRVVHGGPGKYPEVLLRAGNYTLPLVATIYFVWYQKQVKLSPPNTGTQNNAN